MPLISFQLIKIVKYPLNRLSDLSHSRRKTKWVSLSDIRLSRETKQELKPKLTVRFGLSLTFFLIQ